MWSALGLAAIFGSFLSLPSQDLREQPYALEDTQIAIKKAVFVLYRPVEEQKANVPLITLEPRVFTSSPLRSTVLKTANLYRHQHNAPSISWNDSLESYAQSYATTCAWQRSRDALEEDLVLKYTRNSLSRLYQGDEQAPHSFNYDETQADFAEGVGRLTSSVGMGTQTMGCAAAGCHDRDFGEAWCLVCAYWPPEDVLVAPFAESHDVMVERTQVLVRDGMKTCLQRASHTTDSVETLPIATSVLASDAVSKSQGAASGEKAEGSGMYGGQLSLVLLVGFACAFM